MPRFSFSSFSEYGFLPTDGIPGHIPIRPALSAKFVVSRAGEAYDARVRGPNRKFRLGSQADSVRPGGTVIAAGDNSALSRRNKDTARPLSYSHRTGSTPLLGDCI